MPKYRSMNQDLHQGSVDGLYKSISPDRGGVVELEDIHNRAGLLPPQYGVSDYQKGVHGSNCGCGYC